MGIPLGSNFTVNTALPLDDRLVVAHLTARDALVPARRFEGLTVYCVADSNNYQLVGGILNANWTLAGGALPPVSYAGYSTRFNEVFTSTNLVDTLNKILKISYVAPTISFSAAGSGTVREKAASVASTLLTATVTKTSDPIAAVRFYQGATLLTTLTGTIPTGGIETFNYTTPFSDNITFSAQTDDNGATGGPTTVTGSASFTFVYPYYSDAGAVGLSAAAVGALTKTIIVSTATVVKTMTATAGQVFYFAYPASYPSLFSILDVNGFETIGDWTLTTSNITGLDASAQSYKIYSFNNPITAGSYQFTFKR